MCAVRTRKISCPAPWYSPPKALDTLHQRLRLHVRGLSNLLDGCGMDVASGRSFAIRAHRQAVQIVVARSPRRRLEADSVARPLVGGGSRRRSGRTARSCSRRPSAAPRTQRRRLAGRNAASSRATRPTPLCRPRGGRGRSRRSLCPNHQRRRRRHATVVAGR